MLNDEKRSLSKVTQADTVALSVFRDTVWLHFPIEPYNWELRGKEPTIRRLYIEVSCVCPWFVLFRSLSGQVAPGHGFVPHSFHCIAWDVRSGTLAQALLQEQAWRECLAPDPGFRSLPIQD